MKRFKNLSLKQKRILAIAGVAVFGIGIVGTIAYNQEIGSFFNKFWLEGDLVEFTETFDSPDDWQPCQEIPKEAIATNRNRSPRYARMKINEYWRTKDTTTPVTDHETTDLPLTWTDNGAVKHYAIINTQNDDKWEYNDEDGWYYYKTPLAENESTLSLLKSVTFNCEVNTAGEIRYSADGLIGENIPSEYGEANYHLFITFQLSGESVAPERYPRLYTVIARESQGLDNNISNAGVYMYTPSQSDNKPIYLYNGADSKNNIIFADKCWKIVRTAERGATKLIYNGEPTDGKCMATGDAATIATNVTYGELVSDQTKFQTYLTEQYSYMIPEFQGDLYKTPYDTSCEERAANSTHCNKDQIYGSSVTWDGTKYTLNDRYTAKEITMTDADRIHIGDRSHRYYTCHIKNGYQCSEVRYLIDINSQSWFYEITLKDGKTLDDWKVENFANTRNNAIKTIVDDWYVANISASARNFVDDVVYCNDREITYGPLKGDASEYHPNGEPNKYAFYDRDISGNYSYSCNNANDSFTVSSSNGNGDLTYPVAILSGDEAVKAGGALGMATNTYTMTPRTIASGTVIDNNNQIDLVILKPDGQVKYDWFRAGAAVRPVLALKYDTFVTAGTGESNDPYILKEN